MDKTQRITEDPAWLPLVKKQVATLQFGVLQIVVHQGRVTQIERTEKIRLDANPEWEI